MRIYFLNEFPLWKRKKEKFIDARKVSSVMRGQY